MNIALRPVCLVGCFFLCLALPVQAQRVTEDTTLPTNSSVIPDAGNLNFTIEDGTPVGNNLFHSFSEFSVPSNGTARFNNAANIRNIFSRVTGSSVSNIDGLLQTNGNANLFLLNPNGIIFGPNARLNLGGSFYAVTGDRFLFTANQYFSATDTAGSSLLNISAPIGIQFGANPGDIKLNNEFNDLVSNGQNFILAGNNIELNAGHILNLGGRVDIASVGGSGIVGLSLNGNIAQLVVPDTMQRSNVILDKHAQINVESTLGGSIAITGQDISINNDSGLFAGISGISSVIARSGNIDLNARGAIAVNDSQIINDVRPNSVGNAGDINLTGASLILSNGGLIGDRTLGQGNAGNITTTITGLTELSGIRATNGASAAIESYITTGATGNSGNLNFNTGDLILLPGATIQNQNFGGSGTVGNITINAKGAIALTGITGNNTYIRTETNNTTDANDNSGNISISADSLSLNQSEIRTGLNGSSTGSAGNLTLNIRGLLDIRGVTGEGIGGLHNSVSATNGSTSIGNGGTTNITAGSLNLLDGATIRSEQQGNGTGSPINIQVANTTRIAGGDGNSGVAAIASELLAGMNGTAGNIRLTTGSLDLNNGGSILSITRGQGNTGNVDVIVGDRTTITGIDPVTATNSSLYTSVRPQAVGNAGNVSLTTGSLLLNNGDITSDVLGQGNTGRINLQARNSIVLEGAGSTIENVVRTVGAGTVQPTTMSGTNLDLSNGARIRTNNEGGGNAGNLNLNFTEALRLAGSIIETEVFPNVVGNAGDINVTGRSLSLTDGSQINARAIGQGNGGNITATITEATELRGYRPDGSSAGIIAYADVTSRGNGGNIRLNTGALTLRNGALVEAGAYQAGNGGDIEINATGAIALIGTDGETLTAVTSESINNSGNAGNIRITAESLSLIKSELLTGVYDNSTGNAGTIDLNIRGLLDLRGVTPESSGGIYSSVYSADNQRRIVGSGGAVNITAGAFNILEGSSIRTDQHGLGNGGNITVQVANGTTIDGYSPIDGRSALISGVYNRGEGSAGNITLTTGSLNVTNGGSILSTSNAQGNAGNITLNVRDRTLISGVDPTGMSSVISSRIDPVAVGNGGDINLSTGSLAVTAGGNILADTSGRGNPGSITIAIRDSLLLDGNNSQISASLTPTATGNGRDISITGDRITLSNGATLTANTSTAGNGGDINLNVNNAQLSSGGRISTSSASAGNAGDIRVNVREQLALGGANTAIAANSTAAGAGGNISVTAQQVNLTNQAEVTVSSQAQGNAGNLNLRAAETTVNNQARLSAEATNGAGGNLTISSDRLSITNGGQVTVSTNGSGNAGDLTIQATDAVNVQGQSSRIAADTAATSSGNAGSIRITTGDLGDLNVGDRAQITVGSQGSGSAGNLTAQAQQIQLTNGDLSAEARSGDRGSIQLQASDRISLRQNSSISTTASGTATGGAVQIESDRLQVYEGSRITTATASSGQAGNLTIRADDVEVRGSTISAGVLPNGTGNGGNLTIDTHQLTVRNGGQITASTQGSGNAGDITINARDRITVTGTAATGTAASRITATANTTASAGSITLNSNRLQVRDRGTISVSGTGGAGDLNITARRIELDNQARLSAEVASGDRGNITLTTPFLTLTNESLITTSASGSARGGRISLNTDIIVGANNSDIVARAQQGRGGNIRVNASDGSSPSNLLGIAIRPQLTPLSDINAGSASGIDGTIDLILPNFTLPTNLPNLTDLYTATAHTTAQIATCRRQCSLTALNPDHAIASTDSLTTTCQASPEDHFILSGRNGLPPTPTAPLFPTTPWHDLRLPSLPSPPSPPDPAPLPSPLSLLEAQAWITTPSGQIILISQTPPTPASWQIPEHCKGR